MGQVGQPSNSINNKTKILLIFTHIILFNTLTDNEAQEKQNNISTGIYNRLGRISALLSYLFLFFISVGRSHVDEGRTQRILI